MCLVCRVGVKHALAMHSWGGASLHCLQWGGGEQLGPWRPKRVEPTQHLPSNHGTPSPQTLLPGPLCGQHPSFYRAAVSAAACGLADVLTLGSPHPPALWAWLPGCPAPEGVGGSLLWAARTGRGRDGNRTAAPAVATLMGAGRQRLAQTPSSCDGSSRLGWGAAGGFPLNPRWEGRLNQSPL